jgi:hypothetical protein
MRIRLILATLWLLCSFFLLVWVLYGESGYLMAIQNATDREVGEEPSRDRLAAAEKAYDDMLIPGESESKVRVVEGITWGKPEKSTITRTREAKEGITFDALVAAEARRSDEFKRYLNRVQICYWRQALLRRVYVSWAWLTLLPIAALFTKPLAEKFRESLHKRRAIAHEGG